ncbi:MAG: zinc ABC transporter substrate-binding protein, partial [Clostridia bacterium]|nr:zinc ABC transporter substrate-binding protein [Clostridia bacterium]
IVIGMRMMGALLISSLIIFPSVTSMRISKSYRNVIISSCLVSVFCFICGLVFSVKYEAPTGASVVVINIIILLFFTLLNKIRSYEKITSKPLRSILSIFTVTVFASLFVFGFAGGDIPFSAEKNIKASVVATAFAQYDFARQIAGDKADIVMLLAPGEESHTFEPTPGDIATVKNCDLFIYGGGESDKWVDTILNSADNEIKTVKMMDIVELHEEDSHSDEEHHDHSHTEYDEHVWTSPENAIVICEAICNALVEADPKNEDYYVSNCSEYTASLRELSEEIRNTVQLSNKKAIAVGDRFPMKYFCEEYGIEYYAAFPGCSAQVEANPVTIARLKNYILDNGIDTVFKVDLSTGLVAGTVSEMTDSDVATLYSCHVISVEDFEKGETYLSLMERNLTALKIALAD